MSLGRANARCWHIASLLSTGLAAVGIAASVPLSYL